MNIRLLKACMASIVIFQLMTMKFVMRSAQTMVAGVLLRTSASHASTLDLADDA